MAVFSRSSAEGCASSTAFTAPGGATLATAIPGVLFSLRRMSSQRGTLEESSPSSEMPRKCRLIESSRSFRCRVSSGAMCPSILATRLPNRMAMVSTSLIRSVSTGTWANGRTRSYQSNLSANGTSSNSTTPTSSNWNVAPPQLFEQYLGQPTLGRGEPTVGLDHGQKQFDEQPASQILHQGLRRFGLSGRLRLE